MKTVYMIMTMILEVLLDTIYFYCYYYVTDILLKMINMLSYAHAPLTFLFVVMQ